MASLGVSEATIGASSRSRRPSRVSWARRGLAVAAVALAGVASIAAADPASRPAEVWEVRADYTAEWGVPHPSGIAYDVRAERFLIAGADGRLIGLDAGDRLRGSSSLPTGDVLNLAYDPGADRLSLVLGGRLLAAPPGGHLPAAGLGFAPAAGDIPIGPAAGSTFAPDGRAQYVLDGAARRVLVIVKGSAGGPGGVPPAGAGAAVSTIDLSHLPKGALRGIAFNPADGLLYVGAPSTDRLYAVSTDGSLMAEYSLAGVDLRDPQAMTFAPTTDNTDDPALTSLFVADAGTSGSNGRVAEISLDAAPTATAAATAATATLVRTTQLHAQTPPSPDPAGIAYIAHKQQLLVSDSEVNEMSWIWSVYGELNLFPLLLDGTRAPQAGRPYYPTKWSIQEPTGVTYDPGSRHIFISSDDNRSIYEVGAGSDGYYGTADDLSLPGWLTPPSTIDLEDVTYNPDDGRLYGIDGVGREVYGYSPGPDGRFGTGDEPAPTNFDVYVHGARDPEGIAYYPANGSLLVLDHTSRKIYEVSLDGVLLRSIDITSAGSVMAAGLTVAPASDGSGATHVYIVDRGVDNGADPLENDGKMYEMAAGLQGTTPPTTYTLSPTAGAGGSISPATPQVVASGSSLTFTITPHSGYLVQDLVVDGVSVGPVTAYEFRNVAADHTIAAVFAQIPPPEPPRPTVTVPNSGGSFAQGTVVPVAWSVSAPASAGDFQVYLRSSTGAAQLLDTQSAVASKTSYVFDWTVTQPAGTGYTILVWYRDAGGVQLYSDASDLPFSITPGSLPGQPTVTNPNAGGTFARRSVVPITWSVPTPASAGTFRVFLQWPTGTTKLLGTQKAEAGRTAYRFDWKVTQPAGTGYRILIWYRDAAGADLYSDVSDVTFGIR